jgi:hypothetical protein
MEPVREHERVGERRAAERAQECGEALQHDLQVADAQGQEAVEEDEVQQTGLRVLEDLAVPQHQRADLPRPLGGRVREVLVSPGPSVDQDRDPVEALPHEAGDGEQQAEGQQRLKDGQDHDAVTSDARECTEAGGRPPLPAQPREAK